MSDKCLFMEAAYPTLSAEDSCSGHRHEPRVFALARELAKAFQNPSPSDEQVAWFLNDADAVVDDFGGPDWGSWTVAGLESQYDDDLGEEMPRGVDFRLRINGIEYVVPESEWEPSLPVRLNEYLSWFDDEGADS